MRKSLLLLVLCITAAFVLYRYSSQYANPSVAPIAQIVRDFSSLSVGPGTSFFVRDYLYSGHQYPIIGKDSTGDWWELDVDGTPGWIASSTLR